MSAASSSTDSLNKAIDEYCEDTSERSNSSSASDESGGSTDENYSSGAPGLPIEVVQEQLRRASGSQAGSPSNPTDEVETVFSCAVGVHSKTDEQKLNSLKSWYQIPDEFNPRLPVRGEWCCEPRFGIGVYESYFLGGLRFPLNAFDRELLVKLGLGVCQFNPNAWRLIISMQILWREVFGGDRPLTVDEFLYCYKPSAISQSEGFYQFTARGNDCRLIKSLASSDRKWKTEFIFVSGFWAGNPVDVGRDPFPPYTGELGNLRPEAAKRPSLSKFHRDRVHRARLHTDRSFRSLVTLRRLAKWGLGPEPSDEAIAHEVTVRKRMSTMKENRGKEIAGEGKRPEGQAQDRPEGQTRPTAGDKRKFLPKNIDLEGLPSRRDKRVKSGSSKVVKSKPPQSQPAVQIVDVDSSTPVESTPSKTPPRTPLAKSTTPGSSQWLSRTKI
ncbi:uncharacterized protein LOC115984578 [Quercus lobata]|uniref:uncharacterized protein LOC115984578 n=2 Tax=Quercus lobata TaxID=97700 RepID=UPI001247E909|nr:uncharacterized protein LOC115984578 [Quercus lobata]